jgi:5-methylcytosine-specific restriction protein A
MITPLRPCLEPGCAALVQHGRCPTHARQLEQARPNREARRWYYTARWRALRSQVLGAHPLCVVCLHDGQVTAATEVDHIVPHRSDPVLFWNYHNLQALCVTCHSRKTQRGE